MTPSNRKKRASLSSHAATIDVVQQLLRAAGPRKCAVRPSEFDALLAQLDELRDLVKWLERNKQDFLAWRKARRAETN